MGGGGKKNKEEEVLPEIFRDLCVICKGTAIPLQAQRVPGG